MDQHNMLGMFCEQCLLEIKWFHNKSQSVRHISWAILRSRHYPLGVPSTQQVVCEFSECHTADGDCWAASFIPNLSVRVEEVRLSRREGPGGVRAFGRGNGLSGIQFRI